MNSPHEVVVVGAGPIGLATALLLVRRTGFAAERIAVLDRRIPEGLDRVKDAPPDLRVFALSRASERILRACDAWGGVQSTRAAPYERMQVWHADVAPRGGEALVFDAAEIGERDLGVIAENSVLQGALVDAARRAGIGLIEGELTALTQDRAMLNVQVHDRSLKTRLLVGADGAASRVRDFAGLGAARRDYGQTALVAMVTTEHPHASTAWQRFLGDGTLAFLPLDADAKGCRSSIVWSVPAARAERLTALSREALQVELEKDFDGALGSVTLISDLVQFPLWSLSAGHYVTARVALVGDAAHVVHPLAGQGANLGLLDAAALADVLADGVAQREDAGAERILRRYERWRRSENQLMATAIDVFDRLLARGHGKFAELAQRGLPWINRSGLAKRVFIERALGLSGELPAAARKS